MLITSFVCPLFGLPMYFRRMPSWGEKFVFRKNKRFFFVAVKIGGC
jgi:hypothetical protein